MSISSYFKQRLRVFTLYVVSLNVSNNTHICSCNEHVPVNASLEWRSPVFSVTIMNC